MMAGCHAVRACCVLVLISFSFAASFPSKSPQCHIYRDHIVPTFNKSHNFSCRVDNGVVAIAISWKINGTLVKKSGKPAHWLDLILTDKSASGTLRCEAKTKDHDIFCEVKLGDFPRITTRVHFYEVFVGKRLVVPCKSTGNPKPSLAWKKREKLLPDPSMSQSISLKKSSDGLDLVIEKATTAHDDIYICRSVNILGEDTHYALVTVLYNAVQHPPRVVPISPPTTARNGSSVVLACFVNNAPEKYTVVYWEHNGTTIQNSNRRQKKEEFTVKIVQHTNKIERAVMSLAIDHVTPQDAGVYTCGAVTHVDHSNAEVKLVVTG